MATAPKGFGRVSGGHGEQRDAQLRKDRLVGLFALLVIAALMMLLIWLASLGEGPPVDSFPMMP